MAYEAVFRRYEIKYLITLAQKERILGAMTPFMALDQYGRSTVCNLYYDTDSYLLIRRSIEKPVYKEKLRVRSYGRAKEDGQVFVELKKKYRHEVFKRRIALPQNQAMNWLGGEASCPEEGQIGREIGYCMDFYKTLHPVLYLSYEREAYYARDGSPFRITFDDTILCREKELSLSASVGGSPLLPPGQVLMELKCTGGIPLWLVRVLSEEKIYKRSFSKYGRAYETIILPRLLAEKEEKNGKGISGTL